MEKEKKKKLGRNAPRRGTRTPPRAICTGVGRDGCRGRPAETATALPFRPRCRREARATRPPAAGKLSPTLPSGMPRCAGSPQRPWLLLLLLLLFVVVFSIRPEKESTRSATRSIWVGVNCKKNPPSAPENSTGCTQVCSAAVQLLVLVRTELDCIERQERSKV